MVHDHRVIDIVWNVVTSEYDSYSEPLTSSSFTRSLCGYRGSRGLCGCTHYWGRRVDRGPGTSRRTG